MELTQARKAVCNVGLVAVGNKAKDSLSEVVS